MFKNREFRIRVAKTDDGTTDPQVLEETNPLVEMFNNIDFKKALITTSACAAGLVLTVALSNVIEETLIHTAKTKIK